VLHLGSTFDLSLGGRYTVDQKTASLVRTDLIAPAGSFSAAGLEKTWREFTPRAVLTWTPAKAVKFYGSFSKGYTAGGFNVDAAVVSALRTPFDPETVSNYEAGVKALFLERRLRVNVAAFHEKYGNKQELYFNTLTRVLTIVNASTATMNGAEFEVAFTPVQGFRLTGAYALLDAKYDAFVVPGVLNYTGNPLGSAPKHKVSLSADYELRLASAGYLSFVAAYSRTASYYTGATKDPNLFVPSYALVDASIGFETTSRRWRVSLWVRNLANTEYLLTPSTQSVLAEYLGAPRTYGISLGMRY
jgi:iron complex outermembrane receptor protein